MSETLLQNQDNKIQEDLLAVGSTVPEEFRVYWAETQELRARGNPTRLTVREAIIITSLILATFGIIWAGKTYEARRDRIEQQKTERVVSEKKFSEREPHINSYLGPPYDSPLNPIFLRSRGQR